jgi:hypothetical protein
MHASISLPEIGWNLNPDLRTLDGYAIVAAGA